MYPSPIDGNYVVKSGSDVQLVCHAEGSPEPRISWRRSDGLALPTGSLAHSGPALRLPGVEREQAGAYECRAENGVGEADAATLNLRVIYRPVVQVSPRGGIKHQADLKKKKRERLLFSPFYKKAPQF